MSLRQIMLDETANELDRAALSLARASSKLNRMTEPRQAEAVHRICVTVRSLRDALLLQKSDVDTAPEQ